MKNKFCAICNETSVPLDYIDLIKYPFVKLKLKEPETNLEKVKLCSKCISENFDNKQMDEIFHYNLNLDIEVDENDDQLDGG
jgi:hypothetical protein